MNVMGFKFGASLTEDKIIRIMKEQFDVDVADKSIYVENDGDSAMVSGFSDYARYVIQVHHDTCSVIKIVDETIVDIRKEVQL
jgi:hypothetical protein